MTEKDKGPLGWMTRDNDQKNHALHTDKYWGATAPCVVYEKRPLKDPNGNIKEGLFVVWITLNNPNQYNSYTTDMVKGAIAAFENASLDRSVVAVVFTGEGFFSFCTGGNTKEYSEYYSLRPSEYADYMQLFNHMVNSILLCQKPVICRVNGMRVAGGQEIGLACDISIASDLAVFGQAGPKHGSAPVGGSSDFLPWFLSMEDAMWNCVSCEMWSAYKMLQKGMISDVVPVLKDESGEWMVNPTVRTDSVTENGKPVYGNIIFDKKIAATVRAKQKADEVYFDLLDARVNEIIWKFANLFPGCLTNSIIQIRQKKMQFWFQNQMAHLQWLAANMSGEAFLGFGAFNTSKMTGQGTIDFIGLRQNIADSRMWNEEMFSEVMGKPQE
jgi:6-oxocyclohex-1-ene-carbonyl-CoA hydrolase